MFCSLLSNTTLQEVLTTWYNPDTLYIAGVADDRGTWMHPRRAAAAVKSPSDRCGIILYNGTRV